MGDRHPGSRLKLTEKAADAAMALYERWCRLTSGRQQQQQQSGRTQQQQRGAQGGAQPEDHQKEDKEEDEVVLSWDTPEEDLPEDLAKLWQRAQQGTRKLDLKRLLADIPIFRTLPARTPDNNHRGDGRSHQDRSLKVFQSLVGHLLRIFTVLHQVHVQVDEQGEMIALSQQGWLLLAELWHRLNDQRKQWSIPGSVQHDTEVLFSKEDLQQKNLQERIDRSSRWRPTYRNLGSYSFRSFKGGYKGRGGFKGGRFAYGKGSKGHSQPHSQQAIHSGHGVPPRRELGKTSLTHCGSISEITAVHSLVETKCPPLSLSFDSARSNSPMVLSPPFKLLSSTEKFCRYSIGSKSFERLRISGSCKTSTIGRHQAPGTLVCDNQKRWKQRKNSSHFGLSRNKCLFFPHDFSVGSHSKHFPIPPKKLVGMQNRFKGRLFPYSGFSSLKALPKNTSSIPSLGISRKLFRSIYSPSTFHVSHETFGKNLAEKGTYYFCLSGRHLTSSPKFRQIAKGFNFGTIHPKLCRVTSQF